MNLEEEARMLSTSSAPGTAPRTIAFASGKGGTGTSVLALNVAILLAKRGERVVILDGNFGLGNLNQLLGPSPRYDLRHVLAGERRLRDILLRGPHGLLIIPAGSGVAELANLDESGREMLLEQLEEIEQGVDFLLIDAGAGISDTVLNLIMASDETIVVTRQEPTALTNAYALMKVIVQHRPTYPFHLLINLVKNAAQAQLIYDSLAQILIKFLGYRPGYAGFVVGDANVRRSVMRQVPFVLEAPWSPAAKCLSAFVEKLAPRKKGLGIKSQSARPWWKRKLSWRPK